MKLTFPRKMYLILLLILNSTFSYVLADETSPGNRALSFLELTETYTIVKEKHVNYSEEEKKKNADFNEWKLELKDKDQGGNRIGYAVQTGADQWMMIIQLGGIDAGPLAIEDTIIIYAKGGKLPEEKSEQLVQFMGDVYKSHALQTDQGINLYSVIGLNQHSDPVKYMFDKLNIKKAEGQKIYGYMDIYKNSKALNLSTPLASKNQMDFPSWLHLKPEGDLTLELDCTLKMSHLFSKKPQSPLNCNSLFVNMDSIFDYGKVSFALDTRIGIGKKKVDNKADKKENLEKFSQYSFILEGGVKGKNDNELVNVDGVGLKEVKLEFEQSFFKNVEGGSTDIRKDLPKSVYTFGGILKLGETDVGLYSTFAPTTTEPVNVGLIGHVDKVTLNDLSDLAFEMAKLAKIQVLPQNTQDQIKKLPLKDIYLSNVTIAYTPEASRAAGIKQEGFTFNGSLTLLKHLAGTVDINVSEEGVRTKDKISPFTTPGLDMKSAHLNIFIPTSEGNAIKSALVKNFNLILIDLDVAIAGVEQQIKFKIGLTGFTYIFKLNLTPDMGIRLLAEAPVSAITDFSKFKFSADLKTGDPDQLKTLINDLKGELATSDTVLNSVNKLKPDFSDLQARINSADSNNKGAKIDYNTVKQAAQKNLDKIIDPITKAESFLESKQGNYNSYHSSWSHWKHKRDGYHWYQFGKIANAETKVIYYEGLKDAAWGGVKAAEKALAIVKASIHFIPVDAYPSVIEKLAAYRITQYALAIAKGALSAAKAAEKDLDDFSHLIQDNLDFFNISGMKLSGVMQKSSSLSATLTISGDSFHQDWQVSPTITLAAPKQVKDNFTHMLKSLFSPAKYAAVRTKASHSASSYAEFPKGLVLDYEWQKHWDIRNLVPPGWKGTFIDVSSNNEHLYVLTSTNKVKQYSIKDKSWKHVGVGPASREFKHIAVNGQGDVAFVTKNNNLWVNRNFVSTGNGPRGLDVGLNNAALWYIGLNHQVYRYDLHTHQISSYGGYAKRIDVSENDVPWIIGKNNGVWFLMDTKNKNIINRRQARYQWKKLQHQGQGFDIAISKPGQPWVVGMNHALWQFVPSELNPVFESLEKQNTAGHWLSQGGYFTQVAVSPSNLPAMLDKSGKLDFLLKLDNKAMDIGYFSIHDQHAALVVSSTFQLWEYSGGKWFLLRKNIARVDGNNKGEIWAVAKDHSILKRAAGSSRWETISGWATDIAVADNGTVYQIGGNNSIWKYNGNNNWTRLPGSAYRISAAADGHPWVINKLHIIFNFNGHNWQSIPGSANDISIASDNSVWVLGTDEHVWKYSRGNSKWTKINGAGKAITTDENNLPWIVGEDFGVWQSHGPGNQ